MTHDNERITMQAETENQHRLRPYGPVTIRRRGEGSSVVTILDEAREAAGVTADQEFHLSANPDAKRLHITPTPDEGDSWRVEALPDEVDLGTRHARAYRPGSASVYLTLPPDALDILGVGIGDEVELWASTGGHLELRPW